MKLTRITAYRTIPMTHRREELGAIDGEQLTIWATEDGEIQIDNGAIGPLSGRSDMVYDWSDLLGPDYERGTPVRLELTIIDTDDPPRTR